MFQVRFHGRGGQVTEPDALLIQDPTLLHQAGLFAGLRPDGYVLVNFTREFADLGLGEFAARHHRDRLVAVPATWLALASLGRPLPGAPMLGGFAALTGAIGLDAVLAAIDERFSGTVATGNAEAARAAFDFVSHQLETERKALSDA